MKLNIVPKRKRNPQSGGGSTASTASSHFTADKFSSIHRRRNVALIAALIYVVAALLWIFLSDSAVDLFVRDMADRHMIQTYKGTAFVVVTGALLYLLIRSAQAREQGLNSRLREAIDASRDGLWQWDLVNDRIVATPGGDTELGWEAAQAITDANSWQSVVHPDDWAQVADRLAELQRSGTDDWQLEQRLRTREGGWFWYQIKGRVLSRNSDGSIALMEGSYHSIDDLKRTQMTLERTNRALQILVATYDAVTNARTLEDVFEALVTQVGTWPEIAVAWVGQANEASGDRIVPIAAAGPAAEFPAASRYHWNGTEVEDDPTGPSINFGQSALVADLHDEDPTDPRAGPLNQYGIRSFVTIPIVSDEGRKYLLQIAGTKPMMFPSEDSETYEIIARVLAFAAHSLDAEFRFTLSESARHDMAERLAKAVQGSTSALATVVEIRDPYTSGHQHRVAELAVAFGREMGLDEDRLEGLRIGAWIHDVGKIGVPTEILSKPGRLDETEIALIRRHAEIGYEIVKSIDFGWPVERIVHEHHERLDGSGYPQGLVGETITLEARIVAVADVIESMGTNRPYRAKIPWQRVLEEISDGRGTRYDERVVDAALGILETRSADFGLNTG